MAQAKNAPPPAADGAAPKKSGKLIIIIAVLVLLAGGGGGAAWYFLAAKGGGGEHKEEKKEEKPKPPTFQRLEQFTVNLQKSEDGEEHYLQVEMDLQVADSHVSDEIKQRMPQVRNALLLLLSSKTRDDLGTVQGKEKLSAEIVEQINKIINAHEPKHGVMAVFFSSFVIQ